LKHSIFLSDYQAVVLENTSKNLRRNCKNSKDSEVSTEYLNWFQHADSTLSANSMDMIVAADVIYGREEAKSVPNVVRHYLNTDGVFNAVLPLRKNFSVEIGLFMAEMITAGFHLIREFEEFWLPEMDQNFSPDHDNGIWYRWLQYKHGMESFDKRP